MRLDHIAYRVKNRDKTVESIKSLFGYNVGEEFTIDFDDGSQAQCVALTPPERLTEDTSLEALWTVHGNLATYYHLAPEVFVSEGTPDSIVDKWVKERGGIGGIHHLAYSTDRIDGVVKEWKDRGIEFLSDDIIDCPDDDMRQIFTEPQDLLGGMILELIERGDKGFCKESVKDLMESTEEL